MIVTILMLMFILMHLNLCDGIDNNCDGFVDEAPECLETCPDSLPNEISRMPLAEGKLIGGLDEVIPTNTETFNSPCALIVSENGGNRWARYRVKIDLNQQNIRVGDEMVVKVDGKSLDGQAYIALVQNNNWANILESKLINGAGWEKFSHRFFVPSGTKSLDLWLFADFGAGQGQAVYDNLKVRNFNDCVEQRTYYRDEDGDGFGDPFTSKFSCTKGKNWVTNNTDCDDTNAAINPDAEEICDGIDNNCDGQIDEGLDCTVACSDNLPNENLRLELLTVV